MNPSDPLVNNIVNTSAEDKFAANLVERETLEIIGSGLFDGEYYLSMYPDVASAQIKPLLHYMTHGWKEGRNPSACFDTKFYLNTYADVKESNINPLTHYIRFGKSENRRKTFVETLTDISELFCLLDRKKQTAITVDAGTIDIVIPIYNGFEYLEPLFESIVANTSIPYRLIVVDDTSPDTRVKPFLRAFQHANTNLKMVLIENSENVGFVKSVNRAVKETRNHFVLLNSDTEMPPFWLQRLIYPIVQMGNIASTTPFTNSKLISPFPTFLENNQIFAELSLEVIDSYFQLVRAENIYLQIPTGIGFCMGVNKQLVNEIGMFDECFGRGFGEENDWCVRAEQRGYINLQVTNLFVYHKHGGSFPSEEKSALMERNLSILRTKYPIYEAKVQEFVMMDSLKVLRELLVMLISSTEVGASLIIDNDLGGGAHQFRRDKIDEIVGAGRGVFLISYKDNRKRLRSWNSTFKPISFFFDQGPI